MIHGRNNKGHKCEKISSGGRYKDRDYKQKNDKFILKCLSCSKSSCRRGYCETTKSGVV